MRNQIDRRQALVHLSAVGLGGLFVACGGDDQGTSAASSTSTTTGGSTGGSGSTTGGAATGTATAELFEGAGSCAVTPALTEGPYYIDVDSIRSDIREDRQGVPLRLAVRVRDVDGCTPVANAVVDVWHCDATGLYSGFESASTRGGGPGPGGPGGGASSAIDEKRYLRGSQVTSAEGIVQFTTVYAGWYRGRTVHIHTKVHLNNRQVLTTQLYFDENVTKAVYANEPYASDTGRDTFNDNDGIFAEANLLKLTKEGDGYLGVINLDIKSA